MGKLREGYREGEVGRERRWMEGGGGGKNRWGCSENIKQSVVQTTVDS